MHQTIVYCHWKESWWIEQHFEQAQKLLEGDSIYEGLETYTKQQASYELKLTDVWEIHWLSVWQQAKPILQWELSNPLPEGLDVGGATPETIIIDWDDDKIEMWFKYN